MCHFITATVPSKTDLPHLNGVLENFDLTFQIVRNRFVERQLPRNTFYGNLSREMCDCGTPIGSNEEKLLTYEVGQHKIKKLRRRNWSEDRIEKWIEEKRAADEQTRAAAERYRIEALSRWQKMVITVVQSEVAASIGLLKHWYSDGPPTERFNISIQHLPIGQVTAEYLFRISEDTLYVFSDQGKPA